MAQNELPPKTKEEISANGIEPFVPTLLPLIEKSLEEAGKSGYRIGTILIPLFLVWLVIGLTMRRELNCYQVMEWLINSYRWASMVLPATILTDGAISHARVRIGIEVFRILFYKLSMKFQTLPPDFHGFMTVMFDRVTLNMPDTKSNTEEFGKHKTSRGSSAFPLMRAVTLMAVTARVHLDLAFGPYKGKGTGERMLLKQILNRCKLKKALFLLDAGFYSAEILGLLKDFEFIIKVGMTQTIKRLPLSGYADGSYLAVINGITVRVILVQIKGFRPFRLITSLLDPSITALEIVEHYHRRWDIEISYDEIKTHQCATMRGHAPTVLRSKTSDLVKQELYALIISYNMTRWLMYESANDHGVTPLELSFLSCMQWIINAVDKVYDERARQYLSRIIAECAIDRPRRNRSNPRVIKVKMSKFKRKRKKDKGKVIDYKKITKIRSYIKIKKAA